MSSIIQTWLVLIFFFCYYYFFYRIFCYYYWSLSMWWLMGFIEYGLVSMWCILFTIITYKLLVLGLIIIGITKLPINLRKNIGENLLKWKWQKQLQPWLPTWLWSGTRKKTKGRKRPPYFFNKLCDLKIILGPFSQSHSDLKSWLPT